MKFQLFLLLFICFIQQPMRAQQKQPAAFTIVPLGVKGGLDESNLSAWLVAKAGSDQFVCLDAGTIYTGITRAIAKGSLKGEEKEILKNQVKAYCISHPHLDHVAGLILNSPDDSAKTIYGLPFCLDVLRDNYFSWKSWANFGDAGDKPQLKKYHYQPLDTSTEIEIAGTGLFLRAFLLSHSSPGQSTAFLLRNGENYLLYLGDTGADAVEHSSALARLWEFVAPLIQSKKMKGIMIEVSYANAQPDKQLFGHLTPKWLMTEMQSLAALAGKENMKGLNLFITHLKPADGIEIKIKKELDALNAMQLNIYVPKQGEKILR